MVIELPLRNKWMTVAAAACASVRKRALWGGFPGRAAFRGEQPYQIPCKHSAVDASKNTDYPCSSPCHPRHGFAVRGISPSGIPPAAPLSKRHIPCCCFKFQDPGVGNVVVNASNPKPQTYIETACHAISHGAFCLFLEVQQLQ